MTTASAVMLARKSTIVEMTRAEMMRSELPFGQMVCIPPGLAVSAVVLAIMKTSSLHCIVETSCVEAIRLPLATQYDPPPPDPDASRGMN
jgi:hypothetical protein